MSEGKFENELQIDKFALDEEWLKQPMLVFKWGTAHAQAMSERDRAKQILDLTKANLDSDIRARPTQYGIEKITEGAIANAIINDAGYQQTLEAHQKTIHNVNVLSAALSALSDKRYAIDNLTKLHLSGYWAEGRTPPAETKENLATRVTKEQEKELAKNPKLQRLQRP